MAKSEAELKKEILELASEVSGYNVEKEALQIYKEKYGDPKQLMATCRNEAQKRYTFLKATLAVKKDEYKKRFGKEPYNTR
jgi:hypothetical protein